MIDYQAPALAIRYLGLVEDARPRRSARGWLLTHAVAESWFKLLTYKDEYEVARLHLKADHDRWRTPESRGPLRHLSPPPARVPEAGAQEEAAHGKPYEVAFHALQRMKRLRGTPVDVFGGIGIGAWNGP